MGLDIDSVSRDDGTRQNIHGDGRPGHACNGRVYRHNTRLLGKPVCPVCSRGKRGGLGGDRLEELSNYVLGEMKMKALMVTLFVACAVVILGYWLSGLIIHPLHKLIAVMRKVADGDLTTEVPIKRKDEYGQVGEAFNSMTHQLREAMDLRKDLSKI